MPATHPLPLLLALLLAFATPLGPCCAAEAEASPASTPAETSDPPPPCHPQPSDDDTPEPGCDGDCDCSPAMHSACQHEPLPAATSPSHPQLPQVAPALLPETMQPIALTLGRSPAPPPDRRAPRAPAPSLIALSCQLTL